MNMLKVGCVHLLERCSFMRTKAMHVSALKVSMLAVCLA